jgi:hypothetical protein
MSSPERTGYDVTILASTFDIGSEQKGMGYRYWDLARSLHDRGLDVALIAPQPTDFQHEGFDVLDRTDMEQGDIENTSNSFIFCLLEDSRLMQSVKDMGKTLVYDSILTPVEELTFQSVLDYKDMGQIDEHFHKSVQKHNDYNSISDFYLVGTPEEKLLKIGELITGKQVGHADYLSISQRLLTMPVCGYSKSHQPQGDFNAKNSDILWNGGLWNHYDYSSIIDAVIGASEVAPDIHFNFLYRNGTQAYKSILGRVIGEGLRSVSIPAPDEKMPDYREKEKLLAECKGLLLLNDETMLSEMVLPMRLREAILFEKPIIVSDYGRLGALVKDRQLGVVVDNTKGSLRDGMLKIVGDDVAYASYSANMAELKGDYAFDKHVEPLVRAITER